MVGVACLVSLTQRAVLQVKASRTTFEAVFEKLCPDVFDYTSIVIAVRESVVESREAVPLALFLRARQFFGVELRHVEVSPIKRGGIHGETWSDGAVPADNDIVLSRSAIPVVEPKLS